MQSLAACQHVIPTSSYSSPVRFELASQSSPPVPDSRRRRKPFHIWFVPEDDRRRAMGEKSREFVRHERTIARAAELLKSRIEGVV